VLPSTGKEQKFVFQDVQLETTHAVSVAAAMTLLKVGENASVTVPAAPGAAGPHESHEVVIQWDNDASKGALLALELMQQLVPGLDWLLVVSAGDEVLLGRTCCSSWPSAPAVGFCPTDRAQLQATVSWQDIRVRCVK